VTEVLEEFGDVAIKAADGPAGLKVVQSEAPLDLLLTDAALPDGKNGRQLADAARRLRPELPVLFITGLRTCPDRYPAFGAENAGQTKPLSAEDLAGRITVQ
jgi:CheY-like chemotaxis protein